MLSYVIVGRFFWVIKTVCDRGGMLAWDCSAQKFICRMGIKIPYPFKFHASSSRTSFLSDNSWQNLWYFCIATLQEIRTTCTTYKDRYGWNLMKNCVHVSMRSHFLNRGTVGGISVSHRAHCLEERVVTVKPCSCSGSWIFTCNIVCHGLGPGRAG